MPFDVETATFTLASEWLPKLLSLLQQQRSTRREDLDRIADDFGDPVQLAELYVEPHCQQFNPADEDEDEARYVVREPIFSRLRYFFGGHSLTGGHQMFILADSGMGKSSVLMMLKLAHLKSFWPKDYDCALLKIGNHTIEEIEGISGKRRTILLLDALDEDPQAWGQIRYRLGEILRASRNFWRVIISCRTQFFSAGEDPFNRRGKVEVDGFLCPVIYLSLFSEDQIDDYLKKRFPKDLTLVSEAKILLSKMRSLRFRPMLLAHIEDLLHSETKEWNEYSIYHALVSAWLFREGAKPFADRLLPDLNDLWKVCSKLALHLHSSGRRELGYGTLEDLVSTSFRHLSNMEISGRSLLNKNSQGAFRFSHYSIQEFLVAREVILGNTDGDAGCIRSTDLVIRFLLSWLDDQDITARSNLTLGVVNLEGANLVGTDLRSVNLQGGLLRGAQLDGANISHANLRSANLANAQMDKAKLEKADLTGASLVNAKLSKVSLRATILRQADLRNANLESADLTGADLCNATLRGSLLMRANLREANLNGAQLQDAICDQNTVWPTRFDYEAYGVLTERGSIIPPPLKTQ